MQMNPRQLEAFRTVMLSGGMTAAADILKITQPAVSRLIKDLEADMRLVLFQREGNRLVPSREAMILFAEVDRFYVGLDRIGKIANELRHGQVGSLRVASMGALSLSCVMQAIEVFHAARPGVEIMQESLNSHQALELVAARQFDIGFVQVMGDFPGVDITPLPFVDAVCVLPAECVLAEKKHIEPQDLKGLPFISLGKSSPQRVKIDQLFDGMGIDRKMSLQTSLAASAVTLVASGMGVSIVDPFTANTLGGPKVAIRPFRPGIRFEVAAVRPSHHQHSLLCQEFLKIMIGLFQEHSKSMRSQ